MGRYKKIIRWAVMIGCLGYIVYFFSKNRQDLADIAQINPLYIVFILLLFLASHLIYCVRYRILLTRCSGVRVPLWRWFRLVILGRFLSTFVPQAGNVYISIRLKREYKIAYTQYAGSFFSFVWIDTCLNTIYAILLVALVMPGLSLGSFHALPVLIVIGVGIAAGPLVLVFVLDRIRFSNQKLVWLHGKLSEMLRMSVSSASDARYMVKMVLTGLLSFAGSILMMWLCFRSLNMTVSVPALALFYIILKISTEILITPGNIGPREVAYGILSESMGIGMGQGIAVSVIIRVLGTGTVIVLGSCFGGIDLLRHKEDYAEPQEADSEA